MDENLSEGTEVNVAITDYGKRSLTGVPFPLSLSACSRTNLLALPGIGKARGERIFRDPRKKDSLSLENLLDDPSLEARLAMYFTPEK